MDEKLKQRGAVSWSELTTRDPETARNFYGALFGWTFETYPMEGTPHTVFKVSGEDVGGIMATPAESPDMPPSWGLYITVDDVDAAAEKATGLGATVCVPPRDMPDVGRFCVLKDPQGAYISIISYTN